MMNPNRRAFLDMLKHSEGTATCPVTRNGGYDVIVMGVDRQWEIFTDFSAHPFAPEYPGNDGKKRPSKKINNRGLFSSASGAYQFMLIHWAHYRDQLGLPDFGPESQDKWAIQLIRERGALPLIDMGDFAMAVARCRNIWASLPGANYPGQPMHKIETLMAAYEKAGGSFA